MQGKMFDYELIRAAILKQAVKDYKSALKRNQPHKKAELERFFRSDWGQLLSSNHGEYIIENCKRIINNQTRY